MRIGWSWKSPVARRPALVRVGARQPPGATAQNQSSRIVHRPCGSTGHARAPPCTWEHSVPHGIIFFCRTFLGALLTGTLARSCAHSDSGAWTLDPFVRRQGNCHCAQELRSRHRRATAREHALAHNRPTVRSLRTCRTSAAIVETGIVYDSIINIPGPTSARRYGLHRPSGLNDIRKVPRHLFEAILGIDRVARWLGR